jgi:N-acyl-phosphatidylethanolamine-hydrolysing phospholipase D
MGPIELFRFLVLAKNLTNLPKTESELRQKLPVHSITDQELEKFCNEENNNDKIKVIWIGHATSLVNIENKIILMDPVFSHRCSPWGKWVGPARYTPVPFEVDRIPRCDAVLISHNHYDHLDTASVKKLHDKFSSTGLTWFCGSGTKKFFKSVGIAEENVNELSWWESVKFRGLEFVFTPSQHWCGRWGPLDRNNSLWGSWCVLGQKKRFFFAGDTAYCNTFTNIGKKYGAFDLSFIPIGAYHPRKFLQPQHVDPQQAVQLHLDVKSKKSIAIHWATFALAKEFYLAPKEELTTALNDLKIKKEDFVTLEHGSVHEF